MRCLRLDFGDKSLNGSGVSVTALVILHMSCVLGRYLTLVTTCEQV